MKLKDFEFQILNMFKLKLYKVGPTVELQMPWTFLRFFNLPVQAPFFFFFCLFV